MNHQTAQSDSAFRKRMHLRSEILFGIRRFFRDAGFLEVETPTVVALPGMEPNLEPFRTEVARNDGARFPAHLITSPEYSLKKLLASGYERVFEITRCYRNGEPWDGGHNPEFTMIEWYRAHADYTAIMEDTERLAERLAVESHGSPRVSWRGSELDLSAPWPRLTVAEAFERYAGLDLAAGIDDPDGFRAAARAAGYDVKDTDSFDDVFFRVFLRDIEPQLGRGRPVILHEYPRQMAALARLKPGDPRFAERFEAYAAGVELCNAFSELNDADEQRRRLEEEAAERARLGRETYPIDEDFLEAVGRMPDSAGIALGVDRLVMLLTNAQDISDVLFFPAKDIFPK
ncbi:EF-P lysine aminoacylase EpmA [Patescibacteria group bacterium]